MITTDLHRAVSDLEIENKALKNDLISVNTSNQQHLFINNQLKIRVKQLEASNLDLSLIVKARDLEIKRLQGEL